MRRKRVLIPVIAGTILAFLIAIGGSQPKDPAPVALSGAANQAAETTAAQPSSTTSSAKPKPSAAATRPKPAVKKKAPTATAPKSIPPRTAPSVKPPTVKPPAVRRPTPKPPVVKPPTTKPTNQSGCTIKGNIASDGEKIYHVPGQRFYDVTVITLSKGERWFCSEAEARSAGWRKAKV